MSPIEDLSWEKTEVMIVTTTTLEDFETAGVAALVRAGDAENWFTGHFGAFMIAGTRLLCEPALSGGAGLALYKKLEDLRTTHWDWFSPLPDPGEDRVGVEPILSTLKNAVGTLRMSGHPTIYLSSALWVLARRPELATERVVEALIRVHDAARLDDPARHYGHENYFEAIENEPVDTIEAGGESLTGLRGACDALGHLAADQTLDGRHYFLTGEKIHLVTHAHAISTFESLGYEDLAILAGRAQRSFLRLTKASDRVEASVVRLASRSPLDATFWQQAFRDPAHVIKLAEAVVAELPRLPEAERSLAESRLPRMWALLGLQ